jgi:hypothetical protein
MITLKSKGLPLWEIVGPLLFDIGLRIHAMSAAELLGYWILDLDGFDSLIEGREVVDPMRILLATLRNVIGV